MTAPQDILDQVIKEIARTQPEYRSYIGRLDLEGVEPPDFRALLGLVQHAMNQALQLENANASGEAVHPPYYFDYVEVQDGPKNAHAFQYGGFSFIVITLPLVRMIWDLAERLSQSSAILGLVGLDRDTFRIGALKALMFQFQLAFLISHEYAHHVRGHCGNSTGMWSEFAQVVKNGTLKRQAQELEADGYSLYLTLANYVRGAARKNALAQVGKQNLDHSQGDKFLLTALFSALAALFCSMWPENIAIASIWELPHPPAPVRIEYARRVATMWCGQDLSVQSSWFEAERFGGIYVAATTAIAGGARAEWDQHIAFLQSQTGAEYDRQLAEQFDRVRKGQNNSWKASSSIARRRLPPQTAAFQPLALAALFSATVRAGPRRRFFAVCARSTPDPG